MFHVLLSVLTHGSGDVNPVCSFFLVAAAIDFFVPLGSVAPVAAAVVIAIVVFVSGSSIVFVSGSSIVLVLVLVLVLVAAVAIAIVVVAAIAFVSNSSFVVAAAPAAAPAVLLSLTAVSLFPLAENSLLSAMSSSFPGSDSMAFPSRRSDCTSP